MDDNNNSRRQFLLASGGTIASGWLALHWPQIAAAAAHAHEVAAGKADHTLRVLTPAQARDVEAIAAQIVPGGETPGAREAGVVFFVDHIHAGLYARRAPEFLAALQVFQDDFARSHPDVGLFADLADAAQTAYLASIDKTPFFTRMRELTVLGLLALPSYGGNEQKLGWKLVGFQDRHVWEPPFGHYDREYEGFEPYVKAPAS